MTRIRRLLLQESGYTLFELLQVTVILAVTSYFLYSNYDKASQQLIAAEAKTRQAAKTADEATRQYDDMKKAIGSRVEEYEAVKADIGKELTARRWP